MRKKIINVFRNLKECLHLGINDDIDSKIFRYKYSFFLQKNANHYPQDTRTLVKEDKKENFKLKMNFLNL